MAVPSSTMPMYKRAVCLRSQSWSNVSGAKVYALPANTTTPIRSLGRLLMKAEITGRTACSRLTMASPRLKSSENMLFDRSMQITRS